METDPAAGSAAPPPQRPLARKALVLVALAVAGAALARIPAVRDSLSPAGHLAQSLRHLGWFAAPVFILASGVLISLGVPRLLFCPLAGAAFGFTGGMLTSTTATMAAYAIMFRFLRGRLADRAARTAIPDSLAFLAFDPGLPGVIVARLLPVPGLVTTAALSLSPIRWRPYLVGSLIGLLPEAAPLVLLGAGLLEEDTKHLAWLAALTLAVVVVSAMAIRPWLRRAASRVPRQDNSPAEPRGDS